MAGLKWGKKGPPRQRRLPPPRVVSAHRQGEIGDAHVSQLDEERQRNSDEIDELVGSRTPPPEVEDALSAEAWIEKLRVEIESLGDQFAAEFGSRTAEQGETKVSNNDNSNRNNQNQDEFNIDAIKPGMSRDELAKAARAIRRAQGAVEETPDGAVDIDQIRPGASQEFLTQAAQEIGRALRGE